MRNSQWRCSHPNVVFVVIFTEICIEQMPIYDSCRKPLMLRWLYCCFLPHLDSLQINMPAFLILLIYLIYDFQQAKVSCDVNVNIRNQTIIRQNCYPKVRLIILWFLFPLGGCKIQLVDWCSSCSKKETHTKHWCCSNLNFFSHQCKCFNYSAGHDVSYRN